MTKEFYESMAQAHTNMTHWNDCHPCGGDDISRELERTLGKFLRENPVKNAEENK